MSLTVFGTIISKPHAQMVRELESFWTNRGWENSNDDIAEELEGYLAQDEDGSMASFSGREGTVIDLPFSFALSREAETFSRLEVFRRNYESQIDWTLVEAMQPFAYEGGYAYDQGEPDIFVSRHETAFITAPEDDGDEDPTYHQYYLKGHPVLVLKDDETHTMLVGVMNSFNDIEIISVPKSTIELMIARGEKPKSTVALVLEGGAQINVLEKFPHPNGTGFVFGAREFTGSDATGIAKAAYKFYLSQDPLNRNTKIEKAVLLDIVDNGVATEVPFSELAELLVHYWAALVLESGAQLNITEPFVDETGKVLYRYVEFDCASTEVATVAYNYYLSLHPSNKDVKINMILVKEAKYDAKGIMGFQFDEYDPATHVASYTIPAPVKVDTTVFKQPITRTNADMEAQLASVGFGTMCYLNTSIFNDSYIKLTPEQFADLDAAKIPVNNFVISQLRVIPYAKTELRLDKWSMNMYGKLVDTKAKFHGLVNRDETSFVTFYNLKNEIDAHYDEVLLAGRPVLVTSARGHGQQRESEIKYVNTFGEIVSTWVDADVLSENPQALPVVMHEADEETYMPKKESKIDSLLGGLGDMFGGSNDDDATQAPEKIPAATDLFVKEKGYEVFNTDVVDNYIVFFEGVPVIENVIFDFAKGEVRSTLRQISKKDLPKKLFNFEIFSEALWEKGLTAKPELIRNIIDPTENMQMIFARSLSAAGTIVDEDDDDGEYGYNDLSPIKNIKLTDTVQMMILHKELSAQSLECIKDLSVAAQEYIVKRLMPRPGDLEAEQNFSMISNIKNLCVSAQQEIVNRRIDLAKHISNPDQTIIDQVYTHEYLDSDHATEQFIKVMYALSTDTSVQMFLKMKYSYILNGYDEIPDEAKTNPTPELIARYYQTIDDKALALTFMRRTTDPTIRKYLMEKFAGAN